MFGNHGLCGLLEEGAHEKSPKCLGGNLGDFGGGFAKVSDGRVGNKPIRAALRTALGVRVGFSAADRFRGRSCTARRTPECLYFMAIRYF